jgi:D-alanyl-D-alanine dipeptidase
MNKPILQYSDLITVPVEDNGEPLLKVNQLLPEILCEYQKLDMVPYVGKYFFLRKGVIERLRAACVTLKRERPGWYFKLVYAYRHPEIQTKYFETRKTEIRAANPELIEDEVRNRAHLLSASPDVAGHPTGGAIDITFVDESGAEANMGTKIADFTQGEKIQTFYPNLTSEQKESRVFLRRLLMDQGLAPFDGEWWHFSYGDREWAKYYGIPASLYSTISHDLLPETSTIT